MTVGEPERASYVIGESLALWHGRALVDLEGWEPGRVEAGRLEELRLEAEEAGLDASLRAGRHRDVFGEAQALVAASPFREDRWALLALAQYRSGRQGDALRTLHRARSVLAGELGVDPGPDLIALEQAILRQDPSLAPATELPEPSESCPYLGLVPYDVGDAEAFFGRDADVAACLRPPGHERASSWSWGRREAGSRRWFVPGSPPPFAATAVGDDRHARRSSDGRARPRCRSRDRMPVLVVDQCEEAVVALRQRGRAGTSSSPRWLLVRRAGAVGRGAARRPSGGRVACIRRLPASSSAACTSSAAMDGPDLRAAIEGPAAPGGRAARARPRRPSRSRRRRRTGRAPAAVPCAAQDLGGPRGSHAHRRRLPRDAVASEAPWPSRRSRCTRGVPDAAPDPARPPVAPGRDRSRR